ncbi:MAG: nucleotidyltransferase family protein [Candidatus Coproplasma sp.]
MKICAIICEFNPFHNGHAYLIERARADSGCDFLLCVMSGSFTQRGDVAILNKFDRARHAVSSGADCVIELPAPLAVAPAEIFARGAVKLLSSLPQADCLAFGCETPVDFLEVARTLNDESDAFSAALNENLNMGESYVRSFSRAYASCGGSDKLLNSPNNILAVEYAKAVISCGKSIRLLPVKRIGSGYNDGKLAENFSSASAIRKNFGDERIMGNLPSYVLGDLKRTDISGGENAWKKIARYALTVADTAKLRRAYGCSEGLENRLKTLQNLPYDSIVAEATGKRYSSSRIRRILASNALNLSAKKTDEYLKSAGYIKPLAVSKERADEIMSFLSLSSYPVVITGRDVNELDPLSRELFESSAAADGVRDAAFGESTYNYTLKKI